MKLHKITPRANHLAILENVGHTYHDDGIMWAEDRYYSFTMSEILKIEDATVRMNEMSMKAVERIINDPVLMLRVGVPEVYHDYVRRSFNSGDMNLYGRYDFIYDPKSRNLKLMEFNADTPTTLIESAVCQWQWLEQNIERGLLPKDADQFNTIHEDLIERIREIANQYENKSLGLTAFLEQNEDFRFIEYLADLARQAGLSTHEFDISELGYNTQYDLHTAFAIPLDMIFKLYPWEWLFKEDETGPYRYLLHTQTKFIEPPWKALLSTKGILPVLWEMFPGHELLLPAYFADSDKDRPGYVRKPIHGREGAGVVLCDKNGKVVDKSDNDIYNNTGFVYQEYMELPEFDGNYPTIGSWTVGDKASGICIRDNKRRIMDNVSPFVPHVILG